MNEVLTIDFDVKTGKVTKWLDTLRDDISWFQKRIESGEGITLALNKAKVQQDLVEVRRLIKVAEERWDFNALIQYRADENLLKQTLTQSNRELTNFLRTGEKDVSVLGKLFGSLENKIEWVEMELIKMWRSEKEVAHLRNRMNELNDSFKSWTISAQQMAMEMNKLENEMNNIKNAPQGFQEKMSVAYGKVMGYIALITTAIYALKSAWNEAIEGERIDIQLTNRLNGIGSTVWRTKDQIKDLSSALSDMTTIDEDAITNMESRLLNFSNVQGDVFDKASKVALDYATSMNDGVTPTVEDLTSSIDLMWKVLNNPYDGWKKLEKAGIEFTASEELKIQKFEKTNDIIGAQNLIIQKLENQYGSSAEAIKDSTEGMTNSVKNSWNDTLENTWSGLIGFVSFIKNEFIDPIISGWSYIWDALWTILWSITWETATASSEQISIWQKTLYVISVIWGTIKWVIVWVFDAILDYGFQAFDYLFRSSETIWERLKSSFISAWQAVANTLINIVNKTISLMLTPINFAISRMNDLITLANKVPWINFWKVGSVGFSFNWVGDGKWIFDKIWDGLKWLDTWIASFIVWIWKKVRDGVEKNVNSIKVPWINPSGSWAKWSGSKLDLWALDLPTGGGGWGSWKSARDKQLEAEKKRLEEVKKKEEELAKARTTAYEKAIKSSDAFKSAVEEANKKLDEQKRKMDELKAKATETLLDIEEKMSWEKTSLQDKLAQRYLKIFDELRSSLGWADSVFAWATNADLESALFWWQIGGSSFDALKKEIELIKSTLSSDELSLAVTKEKRSETEKITAEYQKQFDLNQREKDVADAKLNNRFLTNEKTGELQFLDKNWEVIQWWNRSQVKDFATQAKEVQDIADESIRIEAEKMTKISAIVKDYEDERARLRNNYYAEDKNLKIAQENMAQAFFKEELARITTMKTEAINLTNALISLKNAGGSAQNVTNIWPTINNNQQSTQVVQVKTVSDVQQVNKTLGIGITLKK